VFTVLTGGREALKKATGVPNKNQLWKEGSRLVAFRLMSQLRNTHLHAT